MRPRNLYLADGEVTREVVASVLDYDPETGVFRWRVPQSNRVRVGEIAGSVHSSEGYRQIAILRRMFKAHRLAWLLVTGAWPKDCLDHINGDRSDNRIVNLREATRAQNAQNRGLNRNNTTGLRGVKRAHSGKWVAVIRKDGVAHWLGTYDSPEAAGAAYVAARARLFNFHPTAREFAQGVAA